MIGNANGIASSGATGNIQTTTRSFNSAGKYTYNGSVAQSTGTGLPSTVTGNITVSNTSTVGVTLTNNLVENTGTFTVSNGGTLNCGTNVISGSGTFTLASGGTIIIGSSVGITTSGSTGNIQTTTRNYNTAGNYNYTSTSAQNAGNALPTTCTGNISINNSSSSGVTISSNYTINTPGVLTVSGVLTCGTQTISGSGTFTLAAGGTLQTSNTSGITSSGATGTIQTTTRNFNAAANYSYTGSSNQVCGNGMPYTVNNLTINNSSTGSSVKLSNNCTINGTLTLTNGTLCLNSNTLTISNNKTISRAAGSISLCSGSIVFGSSTNVTYTGTSSITVGVEMPTTSTGLATLTINNNVGITLSANITVNTQLIMTKGAITLSGFTLTYATGSSLMYNGTNAQQTVTNVEWPSTFNKDITIANTYTTGVILNADKNSYTGNLVVTGVFNVSTFAVKGSGTYNLNAGGTFITAWTTGVVSTAGVQLSGSRTWSTGGNFVFNGSSAQVTGSEMPTTINSLTVNNASGVSLTQNTENTAAYSTNPYYCLYLTSGALSIGAHTLILDGTLSIASGTITGGTSSSIYFGGNTLASTLPAVSGGLSAFAINRSSAIITLGADLTVFDTLDLWTGSLNIAAQTLTLAGTINNTGASVLGGYTSNITINNNANSISLPGVTYGLNNLYINRASNDVYLNGDLTISGTMTLNNGPFDIGANTLDFKGMLTTNSGYLVGSSSSNITVDSANSAFTLSKVWSGLNNFTINRANGVTLSGDQDILGTLALTSGTLCISSHTLEIDGSYTLGTGHITGGATSNMIIGGSTYPFILPNITNGLYNFTLNNSTGITLGANLVVRNAVTFTSGSIALDIYNLSIQTANGISGYGSSSYFITNNTPASAGKLVQYASSSSVIFPVGTSSSYTPATIDNSSATADSFFVRVVDGILDGATSGSTVPNVTNDVNKTWFITEKTPGTTANAAIILQWNSTDENAHFDENNAGISAFDGSNWGISNYSAYNSPSTGILNASLEGLSDFSAFAIGKKNVALPVELLDFKGTPAEHQVNLTWTTATEINNDHFELERSKDAVHFAPIATIQGAGNSNSILNYNYADKSPLSGVSYYRLKQVDFNGKYVYSNIVTINYDGAQQNINTVNVGPNPCNDLIKMDFTGEKAGKIIVNIMSLTGNVIYTQNNDYAKGSNSFTIDMSNIASGVYMMQIQYNDNTITRKIVKSDK